MTSVDGIWFLEMNSVRWPCRCPRTRRCARWCSWSRYPGHLLERCWGGFSRTPLLLLLLTLLLVRQVIPAPSAIRDCNRSRHAAGQPGSCWSSSASVVGFPLLKPAAVAWSWIRLVNLYVVRDQDRVIRKRKKKKIQDRVFSQMNDAIPWARVESVLFVGGFVRLVNKWNKSNYAFFFIFFNFDFVVYSSWCLC